MLSYLGKSQEVSNNKDSLLIVKGLLGENIFVVGDSVIKKRYFNDVIRTNSEANVFFRKGNNLNILSALMVITGGGAIGFTLGSLVSGGEPNFVIGVAGLAILIVHIPIKRSSSYNLKKSTEIYNRGINNNTSFLERSEINLCVFQNRTGIKFKF